MDIHGYPQCSGEINGDQWISMVVHGHPWMLVDIKLYAYLYLMDVYGCQCNFMDVDGYQIVSMAIH